MQIPTNQWEKCYEGGWNGLIVPESFQHPAKMAYGLVNRIYDHAFEQGWLREGDVVADCFGGVGTTGIIGAYRNVRNISVELESRFCILGHENIILHCKKGWCTCDEDDRNYLRWLQEDVSKAKQLDREQQKQGDEEGLLFSQVLDNEPKQDPPRKSKSKLEGGTVHTTGRVCGNSEKREAEVGTSTHIRTEDGPQTDDTGSISSSERDKDRQSLRESNCNNSKRPHEIAQSSRTETENTFCSVPNMPNGESNKIHRGPCPMGMQGNGLQTDTVAAIRCQGKGEKTGKPCPKCCKLRVNLPIIVQGDSREMCTVLGAADVIISSPPYAGNEKSDYLLSDDGKTRRRDTKRGYKQGHGCFRGSETYGQTPGQLGSMKPGDVDAIISSPPYEGSVSSGVCGIDASKCARDGDVSHWATTNKGNMFAEQKYGDTQGNIGNDKGPTFWEAAREIVAQCHQILKPGGEPVKDGDNIAFCDC